MISSNQVIFYIASECWVHAKPHTLSLVSLEWAVQNS